MCADVPLPPMAFGMNPVRDRHSVSHSHHIFPHASSMVWQGILGKRSSSMCICM